MNLEKAYKIFEVESGSIKLEELKKIYRNLAKKYHPDLYINNPLAELAKEKLQEINEAYEVIKEELEKVEIFTNQDFIIQKDKRGKIYYIDKNTLLPLDGEVKIETLVGGYIRGRLKDGLLEGKTYVYSSDGTLIEERFFSKGIIDGVAIKYSRDSNLNSYIYSITEYKNGLLNGKMEVFRLDNFNKRILALEKEYLYGKLINIREFDEFGTLKEEEIINKKEEILECNMDNSFYAEGYLAGKIELKYINFNEVCEVKNGQLNGLSDVFYLKSNTIEKKKYKYGKEEKRFFSNLNDTYSIEKLREFYYEYNNKQHLISMKPQEYHFYIKYMELINQNDNNQLEILSSSNYITAMYNFIKKRKELLIEWLEESNLRQIDYNNAIELKDNIELRKILNPNSLEDYAMKIRRYQMLLEFDDLNREIKALSPEYLTNVTRRDYIKKFTNEIYTIYCKTFGFDEKTLFMKKLPEYMEFNYIIRVFKEADDKGYISNDIVRYVNLFLVGLPKTLSLLNFYIALKYNIDYQKLYRNIKETFLQEKTTYSDSISYKYILNNIYKIENVSIPSDVILVFEMFLEDKIILNEDEPKTRINILKNLLLEIKNKNNIFNILYEKVDKENYEKKIKEMENTLETLKQNTELEEKKKIEESIQKIKERISLISLDKLKENSIEYDIKELSKLSSTIEELSMIIGNKECKDKLREIKSLKNIIECLKDKQRYYLNEYDEIKYLRDKLKKIYSKSPDMFNRCLFLSIIGIILIFIKFGILLGISSIIWLPIIIYIVLKEIREEKVKEARYKDDRFEVQEKELKKVLKIIENFMKRI